MASRRKSLFVFENIKREQLFVSKNSNFQTLVAKDWWPDVHHIRVQHFDSLDDLEDALALAKSKGTKWNQVTQADANLVHAAKYAGPQPEQIEHDIFADGFPVDD